MKMQQSSSEITARVIAIANRRKDMAGALLPILHDVQAEIGYVPKEAIPEIAQILNLSRADVHGVVSFYHDFRDHPPGRHILKVCRAEACQAMGGDALARQLKQALGLDWHETSSDNSVTLEPTYCLGLCACAPALMLDGEVVGRADTATATEIATKIANEARS